MSDPEQMMKVLETHKIKCRLGLDREGIRGGLIAGSEYVWFTNGADIVLYSKTTGCVESSRSFSGNAQADNPMEIIFVQELHNNEKTINMLLVGCSCKSFGLLFVCQFPTLMIVRCIHIPSPMSYISTINNESLAPNQLSDKFKVMSTILLVGLTTGVVFAVDLRKHYIENKLRNNQIVMNELSPSKLFILRKNEDSQAAKQISDQNDFHLAMFINENFCNFYGKQCSSKLKFGISCLLYTEEINAIAIGYMTGHFQLWDCKIMQTLYVFKKPECFMPITHITFLEQADQSNKLCYLWIIQSDNSRLPNATMIALSYEHRIMMSNGHSSYRVFKDCNITLKMSLRKESGIGRCVSALTCNGTLVRKNNGVSEYFGITLFAMLMEIRQNVDASPQSYIFLFDINQWYKAKMPSNINHLKVSNAYASFVKLPDYASYLDFNISDKTLYPFGSSLRNNFKKLFYPSSIYFECDCLLDTEIIKFKHVGVQQEVLNKLILKNRNLFLNPNLFFRQCLQINLRPFFCNKTYDYKSYTVLDKLHFVVSILVENNFMSVFDEYAEKWKKGTHSEVIIIQLVKCLWNHITLVKQYADQLCVPLFDCSGTLVSKQNLRMLNDCLSQILRVENVFKHMQFTDCIQVTNVDLVDRLKIINFVTQYFNAIKYFLNVELLPKQIQENPTCQIIQSDFTSIIEYANKRRMEFGDLPLYLIDAIIINEPNGNKLIEQWKHECIEETKGLYPPSDAQCLLRIYLNAELSNQIKDFITIYFMIDICSVQKMDEITTNIFDNASVKNNELYNLCCASWLFDHDMFEDAMLILASNSKWMVNNKSWNWYHWTVLKLLIFKKQYYWAQIYFELFDIKLVNLDDHKFYVNLQIMNNHCYDALCYLRKVEERKILFEYILNQCLHTNQLKAFLSYSLDSDEKKLFFSCLKKFEDTKLIQFMFLIQEKRYSEALELCKSLKDKTNSKHDYIFKIASILVSKIKDNIPPNNQNDLNKNVFSNEEVKLAFMNCFMDNQFNMMKSNTSKGYGKSCQINLVVPNDDMVDKTQALAEKVSINRVLNLTKTETVKQIEDELLKLLDTPFIQNVSYLSSTTNCLEIPKNKFATFNEQLPMTKLDNTPRTDYNDNVFEKFSHKECMSMKKIDSENENVRNNDINNLPINMIANQTTLFTFHKLLDNTKTKILETVPTSKIEDRKEYEKMDISDSNQSDITNGVNGNNFIDSNVIFYNGVSVENNSDHLIVLSNNDTEANLEKFNSTNDVNDNISGQSDVILEDDQTLRNHSENPSVLLDNDNENNTNEPNIIMLDDANDIINSGQLNAILEHDIGKTLDLSYVIPDNGLSVENKIKQLCVIPEDGYENNLEESYFSLDNLNNPNTSKRQDYLLNDDQSVKNKSYQFCVMHNDEYENNLKESDVILNDLHAYNNSEQSDVILEGDVNEIVEESDFIHGDDPSVENYSYPLCVIPNGEYKNNLEEQHFIPDFDNETNLKESDVMLNDAHGYDNSEQSDVILEGDVNEIVEESNFIHSNDPNVVNYSYQLCVIPNDGYKNHLEEHNFIPDFDNETNLKESDVMLNDAHGYNNNSEQSDIILEGNVNENVESNFIHDDDPIVENYSYQLCVIPNGEYENNLKESDVMLNDAHGYDNSEQSDIILEGNVNENLEESDFIHHDGPIVENYSYQLCVIPNGEYENNLEEQNFIPDFDIENNLKESDVILSDPHGYNNSEQSNVILGCDINKNVEESDFIHSDDPNVENYSYPLCVIPNDEDKNNLEEQIVLPDADNENNLKESDVMLNDAHSRNNSEQYDIILENDIDENLEESGDDQNIENQTDQFCVIPDGENENSLEKSNDDNEDNLDKPDIILEGGFDKNLGESDVLLDHNLIIESHSDKLSTIPGDYNEKNLSEPNVILKSKNENSLEESDFILKSENYKNIEEQNSIFYDTNDHNNFKQSDVLLDNPSVQNYPDPLNVIPDDKNEVSLVEPYVMLDSGNKKNSEEAYTSKQNLIKSFETFINEKTAENTVRDNVIYPTYSESRTMKNLSFCIYDLPKENHSNYDNQIIEEDSKNYFCNKVDNKNTSFAVKKDNIAKVAENADTENKSSAPHNFQIIENHKDLCNDQNEDCFYDEYQFSNNEIFSELSSNCQEFNPIPEDDFNHIPMTGNELNQLEMYKTLNQPSSILLNESFSSKINLDTIAEVNTISQDLVVDNNKEIVINKISKDFKQSSSNTNIITDLCSQNIKSFELVESKDQQVDTNILNLNYATREYSVEIQNSCPTTSSKPPNETIQEFPQNNMLCNDILTLEETSKLDSFTSSSDAENGKHLVENTQLQQLHNLNTNDKNVHNLRKRRNETKCIPVTDTKLTAKSRSKSKMKQVELKTISSNVVENGPEGMSKKRSKCQKQSALKRRKVTPKSVTSIVGASNSKINSEQISVESTKNTVKMSKKVEELLPNNLSYKNKKTVSQEKLKHIAMPVELKQDSENNNETLNQSFFSCSTNTNQLFFQEPKIILERIDVSLYKNCFKELSTVNDSGQVSSSINETNSHKPIAFKRLRSGRLKFMKESTANNTIINLNEKAKKDSINYDNNKVVSRKSKVNSSYKIKKVEFDKNLKSCSDRLVMTFSKSNPSNLVDKIPNNSITETINLISDGEFVSDKVQEEMDKTSSDEEKLDWKIISHGVKTNMNAIPKIRVRRNKSDLNTNSISTQSNLKPIKRSKKIVQKQKLNLTKKSRKSKILKLNQQVRRMSSRKILKKPTCLCCTSNLMDGVCGSNVV